MKLATHERESQATSLCNRNNIYMSLKWHNKVYSDT